MNSSNPYTIDDLIVDDPFRAIFDKNRDSIFYEHVSYKDYLNFLRIIGARLKDSYRNYGELAPQVYSAMERQQNRYADRELQELLRIQQEFTYQIQLDQESFVIFSKILLDKLGLLIEKLIHARGKNNYSNSFTDHKKWFIKNSTFNRRYSQLLIDLYWYDQFLDVIRNKIIEHGGALSPMFGTTRYGIRYRRKQGIFGILSEKDQAKVIEIIKKYEQKDEMIKNIAPNPYMMLDELMELILEHNIKLDKEDLDTLGIAVKNSGGIIDAVILAKHIRKFLNDAAVLFI